jgi:hypothetical protein
VCVACLSAEADNFSPFWDKNSLLGKLSSEERKKNACSGCEHLLFFLQESLPTKEFLSQHDEKSSASAQR